MKQSKRLLSVLLAMIMVFSMFTVGVSAYKTSYKEPHHYDSILTPVFTNDQAATALLDMLDDKVFAPMDVHESILGIDVNIYSLDSLCDSLEEIQGSTLYGIATVLDLGDIEELNVKILRNSANRRRSTTLSDFELFKIVCGCLALDDNADVIAGIVDGSFDLGLINNWFDLYDEVPMLKNLHGYLCDMVYVLLINNGVETGYQEGAADNYNLDSILQTFINDRVLTFVFNLLDEEDVATVADFLSIPIERDPTSGEITNQMGLLSILPSLTANDVNINTTPTYTLINKLVNALIDDLVIPFAGPLILDLLEVAPDDYDATEASYFDAAISLFVDYNTLVEAGVVSADTPEEDVNVIEEFLRWKGVENPERPKPIDKLNVGLEYILKVGLKKFLTFEPRSYGSQLQLTPYFADMFSDLIRMVVPMLPSFTDDFAPLTAEQEAEIETMQDEKLFAFLLKMILEAFVDGVYFPEDKCDTIKQLATYTLVNVCEELVHSSAADFELKLRNGEIDANNLGDCLNVAASVLNYYLVGQTTFESSNLTPTFDQLLNDCFDTFLSKYAALFSMGSAQNSTDAWLKLHMTVNQWIPLTTLFCGVENSRNGLEDLLLNSIIGNVLNFDINGLLGIIGRNNNSDLSKPLAKVIIDLLARIINGVFKLPVQSANQSTNDFQRNKVIIPYDYTALDQVVITYNNTGSSSSINQCGLYNTARMLVKSLPNITADGAVAAESLDLICELIGVLDLDQYGFIKRQYENLTNKPSYSMNQLKTLYNELKIPDNEGLKYYDDDYYFCHTVDYDPWTYKDFKGALGDAESLIEQFDRGETVKRADISYAYYYLLHVHDDYLLANQPAADNFYLNRIITENPRITANVDDGGEQKYTNRSWDAYVHAYDFAEKVMREYQQAVNAGTRGDYPQSKVNTARSELRDAIRGLKLNAGLGDADYTALLEAISNIAYLDSPAIFTDKSVQNVIDAYNDALAFSREVWYDADSQEIVDNYTEKLTKAYGGLVNIAVLEYYDPYETYFLRDEVNSYLYGFQEPLFTELDEQDFGTFYDYMDQWLLCYPTQGCSQLDLVPTANGNGTGSKVRLRSDLDGDGVYTTEREYTVIFFGDVNGDGNSDAMDGVILRCFASRLLTKNANNAAITYAGDVDCDDLLSTTDANAVINAGVYKAEINQAPAARADNQVAFTDLVNA